MAEEVDLPINGNPGHWRRFRFAFRAVRRVCSGAPGTRFFTRPVLLLRTLHELPPDDLKEIRQFHRHWFSRRRDNTVHTG